MSIPSFFSLAAIGQGEERSARHRLGRSPTVCFQCGSDGKLLFNSYRDCSRSLARLPAPIDTRVDIAGLKAPANELIRTALEDAASKLSSSAALKGHYLDMVIATSPAFFAFESLTTGFTGQGKLIGWD